jgi:hypothetical protein
MSASFCWIARGRAIGRRTRAAPSRTAVASSSAPARSPTACEAIPIGRPVERSQRDRHALARLAEPLRRGCPRSDVGGRGGVEPELLLLARDREALAPARTTNALARSPLAREDEER